MTNNQSKSPFPSTKPINRTMRQSPQSSMVHTSGTREAQPNRSPIDTRLPKRQEPSRQKELFQPHAHTSDSDFTGKNALLDRHSHLSSANNDGNSTAGHPVKPIQKYLENSDAEQKSFPLKYFKGQDLELYYMEKQLKPGVEREIKEGFFEIRKKFGGDEPISGEEVQVYVSHLCLHNYHPIFCKFNLNVVKTILNYSQIIYLKKGQTLYSEGFNEKFLYIILFGKLSLHEARTDAQVGQALNIGWTVGEEILFKSNPNAPGKS